MEWKVGGWACLKGAALKVVCDAKRNHKFLIPITCTGISLLLLRQCKLQQPKLVPAAQFSGSLCWSQLNGQSRRSGNSDILNLIQKDFSPCINPVPHLKSSSAPAGQRERTQQLKGRVKVVEPQHKFETAFQVTSIWNISSHQLKKNSTCDGLSHLQNTQLSDEKGAAVLSSQCSEPELWIAQVSKLAISASFYQGHHVFKPHADFQATVLLISHIVLCK